MAPWNRVRSRSVGRGLIAAARILTKGNGDPEAPGSAQPWQVEVYDLVDRVPEGGYVATFVGDAFSRTTLAIGRINDEGQIERWDPEDAEQGAVDDDGAPIPGASVGPIAVRLLNDFRAPVGGQAQLMRSTGSNLALAGECNLVGVPQVPRDADGRPIERSVEDVLADPGAGEQETVMEWEVLSVLELASKGRGDQLRYVRKGGVKDEELPAGTIAARIWLPDFRFQRHARGMFRNVLPTMRKIAAVDARFMAEMNSRQNAGLLVMPSEADWPASPDHPDGFAKFVDDLIATMTTPIKDPQSTASIVPNVVEMKADLIEKIKHFTFDRPTVAEQRDQREGVVGEFARGVQLPVETVIGIQGSNHWSAWLADESLVKSHLEPLLDIAVDAFTATYLRPSLQALDVDPEEADRWVVMHDTSELSGHPDRGKDATEGYDRGEISGRAWRQYKGFSEGDAPDEEELARRQELLAVIGKGPGAPAPGEGGASDVEAAPPEAAFRLAQRLADAAEVAVGRAVERTGNQLRNKANGKPGIRELVAATPPAEVAVALGPSQVERLLDGQPMFVGEFGHFARTARRWAHASGHPKPAVVMERAMVACEALAKERLYDPERLPTAEDFALVVTP